jgi:hypothetical protein
MSKEPTAFQRALASRERYQQTLDISGFFGPGGKPLPKAAVRIPRKSEDISAIAAARQDARNVAKSANLEADSFDDDDRVVAELEQLWILYHAFRDAEDPDKPLFHDPVWMRENLDNDQLGCMRRLLEEVRKRRGPLEWDLSEERIEAIRQLCVEHYDKPVPEQVLAHMDHIYLTAFVVEAMKQWHDERRELLHRLGENDGEAFSDDEIKAAAEIVIRDSEAPKDE